MNKNEKILNKNLTNEAATGFLYALGNFYVSGYYLDLETKKYIAIGQTKQYNDAYNLEGDWSLMDQYIKDCVNPLDQEKIYKASRIDYIKMRLEKEKFYSIEIRDIGTGVERWYRYTTMRGMDKNHAAIAFVDATDQVLMRHKLEEDEEKVSEAYGMIEGFSQEYHTIWVVDKVTSEMRLIRSNGKSTIQGAVQMGKDLPKFDEGFDKYIETYVEPEDRMRMHKEIAFKEILKQLEKGGIYSVNYLRRDDSGHVGYHQVAFANADTKDGKLQFVYGFRDVDKLVKEEQKKQEELKDALKIAEEATAEQEVQLEEIQTLNNQLESNQSELEAQLEEIQALNNQLESNQAELEASLDEQKSQLDEISKLNKDLVKKDNQLEKSLNVVGSLSKSIHHLYDIDLVNDTFTELGEGRPYLDGVIGKYGNAKKAIELMCNTLIADNQVEEMMKFCNLSTIDRRLNGKNYISIEFSDKEGVWFEGTFIVVSRDSVTNKCKEVLYALRSINDFKQKEIKARKEISEYSDAMTNAGYGMWHIILKDGVKPRMIVNEKMAELLGIDTSDMSEEEIYNAWYNNIDKDAIPSVQKSVGEMMEGKFSENTYKWLHPTKGMLYVRCGGTCETLPDGTHLLSGYHTDVTSIVLKDEELKQELREEKEKISDAYGMIEGFSKEYHTIWVVDKITSEMRLIRSTGKSTIQGAVQMGLDLPKFDEGFDKYIETYIEPEDRQRMHKEIAFKEILHQLKEKPNEIYAVNYLRRDESGKVGYHQIAFANADTKDGKLQFVYGFRDIEKIVREEQKRNEKLKKAYDEIENQLHIMDTLSSDYQNVFLFDQNTGISRAIVLEDGTAKRLNIQVLEPHNYSEVIDKYLNSGRVYDDDLDFMKRSMKFENVLKELETKESFVGNFRICNDDKTIHYLEFKYRKVQETDLIILCFVNTDKIMKEQLERNKELALAKEEADSANAAKTSFLFNMSHDIRTPMNAIMGFRDLLEKYQDDPVRRQNYLDKIKDSSEVLLSIINNVLEMARIEKGSLDIIETAWSTEQFNDTLFSIFNVMMKEKNIEFTRSIDVKEHFVYCDPTKLREIFINILSNAYKYTLPGGKVHMELKEIPYDKPGFALYQTTISDTGIGISEEYLPHIFEEFSRENNTTEAKIEGTGLGLPIVKRLVEILGGTIEVKSKKGVGSTFIVTIPHRVAEKEDLVSRGNITVDPNLFKGKHILLAEDNDLNAEIAMEILGEAGFIIDRAKDGLDCLNKLKEAKPKYYDVILMDIQMPNMNGYDATKAIRLLDDPDKANIKIIAMTANAFEEDKRNAIKVGMNGHIAKPINVNELMKTLASIIG